jgi:hypothetical protein
VLVSGERWHPETSLWVRLQCRSVMLRDGFASTTALVSHRFPTVMAILIDGAALGGTSQIESEARVTPRS